MLFSNVQYIYIYIYNDAARQSATVDVGVGGTLLFRELFDDLLSPWESMGGFVDSFWLALSPKAANVDKRVVHTQGHQFWGIILSHI